MHTTLRMTVLALLTACSSGGGDDSPAPLATTHSDMLGLWLGGMAPSNSSAPSRAMNFTLEEKPNDPTAFWCRITFIEYAYDPQPPLMLETGDMRFSGLRGTFDNGVVRLVLHIDPNDRGALSGDYAVLAGEAAGEMGLAFAELDS